MFPAVLANSGSSFLPRLTFQSILVIYIKYNIIYGVYFQAETQYEVQSPQRHNHQTFLLLWTFLLNHTLIMVVSSIISVYIWLSIFCICTLLNNAKKL